jgi:hypothetical protein
MVVEPAIIVVQEHVGARVRGDLAGPHHVIEVGVRVHDLHGAQPGARERREDLGRFVAGSITSASFVSGQLTIVQLHPSAPTGKVMRSSGTAVLSAISAVGAARR